MSERFEVRDTPITELRVLQRKPVGDTRGYLERLFCQNELSDLIGGRIIRQINHTFTARVGTVRGLHFQNPPHAETKFVSCISGEVFDVAVDLRRSSPTFLRYHAEVLSAENHKTYLIPEGFAHGFQSLSEDSEMLYFHTAEFEADAEGGLNATDPKLDISWPLEIAERSNRDVAHAYLTEEFPGIAS